jgi:hypothetical protein
MGDTLNLVELEGPLSLPAIRAASQELAKRPRPVLYITGTARTKNIDFLRDVPQLEGLICQDSEIENYHGLETHTSLRLLHLGRVRDNKVSLGPLQSLSGLEALHLIGSRRDWDTLWQLSSLRSLIIRSPKASKARLPVESLTQLQLLRLLDANVEPWANISELVALQYLEIWMPRAFENLDLIRSRNLELLFIQSAPRIRSLETLSGVPNLRRLHLEEMKNLASFAGIEQLTRLEELAILPVPIGDSEVQRFSALLLDEKKFAHFERLAARRRILFGEGVAEQKQMYYFC